MIIKGSCLSLKFQRFLSRYLGSGTRLRTQNSSVGGHFRFLIKWPYTISVLRKFPKIWELSLNPANLVWVIQIDKITRTNLEIRSYHNSQSVRSYLHQTYDPCSYRFRRQRHSLHIFHLYHLHLYILPYYSYSPIVDWNETIWLLNTKIKRLSMSRDFRRVLNFWKNIFCPNS